MPLLLRFQFKDSLENTETRMLRHLTPITFSLRFQFKDSLENTETCAESAAECQHCKAETFSIQRFVREY